jgi:hypothetical protein
LSVAIVQQVPSTSTSVTISAMGAGNSGFVLLRNNGTTANTGVSGGGVTWTLAKASNVHDGVEIWAGANSSGSGTTITVGVNVFVFIFVEVSGMPSTLATDGINSNSAASGSPLTTGSVTPTAGKPLIIFAAGGANTPTDIIKTPLSGTELNDSSLQYCAMAYQIVSSASGSYSNGWNSGGSSWDAVIAAFDGSSGGGATPWKFLNDQDLAGSMQTLSMGL